MKFLAILQIVLLLATCMVPEGRYLLAKSEGCTNGCGCTTESRQSGNCCCSKAKDTANTTPKTRGCSNCKAAVSKTPDTHQACVHCPTGQSEQSCCSSTNAARPVSPQISSCPCGSEVWELQVIMMPRVKTAEILVVGYSAPPAVLSVQHNRLLGERPQPESPPPQNLPC